MKTLSFVSIALIAVVLAGAIVSVALVNSKVGGKTTTYTTTQSQIQTLTVIRLQTVTTTMTSDNLVFLYSGIFTTQQIARSSNGSLEAVVPVFLMQPNTTISLYVRYSCGCSPDANDNSSSANQLPTVEPSNLTSTSSEPFLSNFSNSFVGNFSSSVATDVQNSNRSMLILFRLTVPTSLPAGYYLVWFPFSCSLGPAFVSGISNTTSLNYSALQQMYGHLYANFGCPAIYLAATIVGFSNMNFTQVLVPFNASLT